MNPPKNPPKNSKGINIPCTKDNFYRLYLTFLCPLHKLTSKSIEVAAELLKERKRLSKVIKDPVILYKNLFGPETKTLITQRCDITSSNYYVVIGKLKKAGFILNDSINPRFIPDYSCEDNNYHLHIMFNING